MGPYPRISLALLITACGPTADQLYAMSDNAPGTAEPPPLASDAPATPAPRYAATLVATARAACASSPGSVATYGSVETFATLLQGSWAYCDGMMFIDADFEGVEFTPDGHFYYLAPDPGGDTVRAPDVHSSGTYGIFPFDGDLRGRLQITFDDGDVLYSRTAFESGPRRMHLDQEGSTYAYFVPLGE